MWSPNSPAVCRALKAPTPKSNARSSASSPAFCLCCHNTLCTPSAKLKRESARKVFADMEDDAEPPRPTLDNLPPDVLEIIGKHAGADLPAFACVSTSIASAISSGNGTLWRSAYEMASPAFDVEGWGGDVMAGSLWKACLARRVR